MPSFIDLFDHDAERLRGIVTWDDVTVLGRSNLDRLIELVREGSNAALAEDRLDDARARAGFIAELQGLRDRTSFDHPILPRMRVEIFRIGMPLAIFLGDSPGSREPGWVTATVTGLAKNFRPEWKTARGNSGYFWEVTATFSDQTVRFSTTDPRVLPLVDLDRVRTADPHFRRIFATNCWRDWNPLWCIDRGVAIDAQKIDFDAWLSLR